MSVAMAAAVAALVLLALILLRFRRQPRERRSRPRELANGELLYMEHLFRIRTPIALVARVDRVYRLPGGSLVLVELKTRARSRPYLSDVIQLSAQRLALEVQTGATVAPYAFVSVRTARMGGRVHHHRVQLLDAQTIVQLRDRREHLLDGRLAPAYAGSAAACRGCALRNHCDRPS